jgi:hypothetical protein
MHNAAENAIGCSAEMVTSFKPLREAVSHHSTIMFRDFDFTDFDLR